MLRSIGKQSGESVESVLKKNQEGDGGKDLRLECGKRWQRTSLTVANTEWKEQEELNKKN